eukprot:gb/GECH01004011.1/.p1 GENE.gb/GECH01004011.1/~~gb/GECH01004011.1/.p1  ORF type:complete len:208 (+),score=49.22 gb/GECH01004011.1/:1-624(+)
MRKIKLAIVGHYMVGKRSIAFELCGSAENGVTKTLDVGTETVQVKIKFVRASNARDDNEITKADGFMLVYSVTSEESLRRINEALSTIDYSRGFGVASTNLDWPGIIVANKIDQNAHRVISSSRGEQNASAKGFNYYEVCARSGKNVSRAFFDLVQLVLEYQDRVKMKKAERRAKFKHSLFGFVSKGKDGPSEDEKSDEDIFDGLQV